MLKKLVLGGLLLLGVALFLPGCKGGDMGHRFGKEMVVERMDKMAKDLNLSQEQMVKFESLKTDMMKRMDEGKKTRQAFRDKMIAEIRKEKPDINVISDMAKNRIDEASKKAKEGIDLMVSFYNILDDTQQKTLAAKIQKKIDAFETIQE